MIVFLWTTIRWVADVRRDIAELPLDHSPPLACHGPES